LGLGLESNPNPKRQKNLGFKNISLIPRYFNKYIFSDFFIKPKYFWLYGFGFGSGFETTPITQNPKTQKS